MEGKDGITDRGLQVNTMPGSLDVRLVNGWVVGSMH